MEAAQDFVERRGTTFVHAIAVMKLARTIDGQSYQPVFGVQEFAPSVVEEHAVGLQRILNAFTTGVLLLQLAYATEIADSQERGFSALPGEGDRRHGLRFDVLADVTFEHVLGHGPLRR